MELIRSRKRVAVTAWTIVIAVSGIWAASVAGDFEYCEPGSGAGQCDRPSGVAIDAETGDVYVADTDNDRIVRYDEVGNPKGTIDTGPSSAPKSIAVDNDPGSLTQHDVFVVVARSKALRFSPAGTLELGIGWGVRDGSAEAQTCGPEATPPTASCLAGISGKGECQLSEGSKIAVGPGGTIYISDSAQEGPSEVFKGRVEKFAPDGSCEGEQVLFEGINRVLRAIAVDSEEDTYIAIERNQPGVLKLGPAGNTLCEFGVKAETSALVIDPASGRLLAAQREGRVRGGRSYFIITEYAPDPGCPVVRRFGYTEIEEPVLGLAVFPGTAEPARAGNMLVSEGSGSDHKVFQLPKPAPGPIIVPGSAIADPISNTKATLGFEFNPEGAKTEVNIQYVEESICKADEAGGGECFDEKKESGATLLGFEDFSLHAAETQFGCPDPENEKAKLAEGKCLKPETSYRFRVEAVNADGKGNSPLDGGSFKTLPWILFGAAWSTSVGPESALLHAEVNPLGVHVTARFQVIDDAHYEANPADDRFAGAFEVPAPSQAPLDYGKGEDFVLQSAALGGLAPHTTYHYRLLADNPLIDPLAGPEHILTTFAPPGSEPCPANEAFRTGPSALLPDCRAYEMVSPLEKGNGDIIPLKGGLSVTPAVLVQSSLAGSRFAYGSSRAFGDAPSAPWTSQYIAARGPEGWASHAISSPIGKPVFENAIPNTESELKALSPDLCDAWLRTIADPPLPVATGLPGVTGFPNIYRRSDDECGGPSYEALTTAEWKTLKPGNEVAFGLELQGLSADGSHAIFLSPDNLAVAGAPPQRPQLYLWAGGPKPVFACILPGGAALSGPCSGGYSNEVDLGYGRFASKQGAISADGERVFWTDAIGRGKIYLRERGEQGKVSGECNPGKPCTIPVSAQGEAKSGTSASRFRAASKDGSKLIFSTGPSGNEDLYEAQIEDKEGVPKLAVTQLIAGGLKGVMGVSEDATHVYFASSEAIPGKDVLGKEAKAGDPNLYLYRNGSYAFIGVLSAQDVSSSVRGPIAAAPIENLARIAPDGEHAAFLSSAPLTGYDNADALSGEADSEVFRYDAAANRLLCASCNPSGARPVGRHNAAGETILYKGPEWLSGWIGGHQTNLYASRELSDDGSRLFFNSTDALIARDTNGRADVYEWEAAGTGGCKITSSTYSGQNEGCLDLISSGQSAQDSEFLDASPSGDDVFFTTLSSLLVQDYGLVDVYDASAGGGFPPPPVPPSECEGEACQSPPPAPIQPTPATSVPAGDGNLAPRCPKGRHKVKRKGKARCVKRHAKKRHDKRHHHRADPERRAGR